MSVLIYSRLTLHKPIAENPPYRKYPSLLTVGDVGRGRRTFPILR